MSHGGAKSLDLTELQWERLAIRMLHKVCPSKDTHGELAESHCPQCGLNRSDYDRFIVGNEGER